MRQVPTGMFPLSLTSGGCMERAQRLWDISMPEGGTGRGRDVGEGGCVGTPGAWVSWAWQLIDKTTGATVQNGEAQVWGSHGAEHRADAPQIFASPHFF